MLQLPLKLPYAQGPAEFAYNMLDRQMVTKQTLWLPVEVPYA